MPSHARELIVARRLRALTLAGAHAENADAMEARRKSLGVPVVILSAVVGTTAFASLATFGKTNQVIGVITGILSLCAAVLSGLQTFMNYGSLAQKHNQAASNCHDLVRAIDRLLLKKKLTDTELVQLDERLKKIIDEAPRVSVALQDKAERLVKERNANTFYEDRATVEQQKRQQQVNQQIQ
jgi:hypothetical protein